jgi:hypothetical protein
MRKYQKKKKKKHLFWVGGKVFKKGFCHIAKVPITHKNI